jgi:hypothetical protein
MLGSSQAIQRHVVSRQNAVGPIRPLLGLREGGLGRYSAFLNHIARRYLGVSSRSELILAPEGTGHNSVFERPAFVVEQVQRMIPFVGELEARDAGFLRA